MGILRNIRHYDKGFLKTIIKDYNKFMFPEPIYIFGFPLHLFGIIAATSLIAGYLLYFAENKRLKIPSAIAPDVAFAVLMMSFVGARLLFIILNWEVYLESPIKILLFWEGGLVLHGGILGGLLGGYLYCLKTKQSFSQLCDPVALGISLGLALSRLGCFAAGCCYGKPTSMPWGITFHNQYSLAKPLGVPLHPTQLYEFLIGMLIFLILFVYRKRKTFNGEILLLYLLMAPIMRIGLERFRANSNVLSLIITFAVFTVSSVLYYKYKRRSLPMNKSMFGLVLLVIAVAICGACTIARTPVVSRGYDIKTIEVKNIVEGKTIESEIIKMFGPPAQYRITDEGKEFLYDYAKAGGEIYFCNIAVFGGTKQKTLLISFDKKGVVTKYVYKES